MLVRLLQASIAGFGRLVDRQLSFARHMQILVGPNEAGKSTLQQFLLAALFGLKREGRKRRDYLPQYERYRPWEAVPYEGSLRYELSNGEQWEVQRVFDRDSESLRLFDALTGEERTESFPMDSRKERNFMLAQLHLSRQLFEATTSLGQLAGQPSEEGVGMFRERLQGLLDSGDEDVSARRALACLQNLRDQFGTERTPSRGRGRLSRLRQELEQELDAARQRHTEVLDLFARRNRVIVEHQRAEADWRRARAHELGRQHERLQQRLLRADILEQSLDEARRNVALYDDVRDFDVNAYTVARETAASLAEKEAALRPEEEEVRRGQDRLEDLQAFQDTLAATLGGMDRVQRQHVEREAERLRETIGRYREARRRNLQEQEVNKRVVEQLTQHHGRDWTQEAFMARLASESEALDPDRNQPLQRAREVAAQEYGAARRKLMLRGAVAVVVVMAATAAMIWSPGPLPLFARVGLPVLLVALSLGWLPRMLRLVLARRDQFHALASQLQHRLEHGREARQWVQDALERNGMQSTEQLRRAHEEYLGLRAAAQASPETAALKERIETEEALRLEAQQLRHAVAGCDFDALRRLLENSDSVAHEFLPFAEDASIEIQKEDSSELTRLAEDLRLLPELRRGFEWVDRLREEATRLDARLAQADVALQARRESIEHTRSQLQRTLERFGVADLQEFTAMQMRHRERQQAEGVLTKLQSEQSGILGGETLARLRQRVEELATEMRQSEVDVVAPQQPALPLAQAENEEPVVPEERDVASVRRSLEELGHEVERLAAERAQLEERLTAREREGRTPAEVQLELDEIDLQIQMEERRDQALLLAMQTLETVSSRLHREVAPQMNARVGEFFQRLSLGRHEEVLLDETLTPRIRTAGGKFREVDSLSGGAADQLYFALRVTAGEQLARSGEHLPLLLDDPFVQYDPERMAAAIDVVTELARDHQVFFFTCEVDQGQALLQRARQRGLDVDLQRL
jgi:DNA repair exonuclease SbcCD ATPase subunit